MMELQYNGHAYSKRFSRELITVMCAEANPPCNAFFSIDWRRSSRRQLRVRDKRVGQLLQRCSGRYFWPDGVRFTCHQNNKRRYSHRPFSPLPKTPPPSFRWSDEDTELELYAKEHGYDLEEGEISPGRKSMCDRLENLSVKNK
ncbi:late expression factor 6 [Anticarsia gemmatalis multiple nucleopolyhedrovirus]|uniref:Late expression factor 6 n=1 Tax=Anticarsia gemmatalis multiple nucleopolyhedrovirus TaxID=268591 RepID=A0A0S3IX75_9ABAC|nr:late expression factor 6 [Anticarsia gemmatalis multiple nucleopolyhedrovirus]YP_803433.1 late expression factor 6 [Anticarsia gemmatalis nucleopolyhedrovirus]ABI13823.1 late expression factor 6 [Anticarsia gemmatalis multiple nucleopolyhedrovirus]ALR69929.1 late expression factor 6 [Anticarsia gemmatalis multiple nucleopolyhedrovirus]ALR70087.1 late expression factor 6 [Anticarsia gemmatalis multiple nucleopolyhedrovirus]ALR70244.1 late expression factor 6 [Anticarsia gemmatalis multiple n